MIDKCAIATTAHEYLAAGEDHWTKNDLVKVPGDEMGVGDEASAYKLFYTMADPYPVCLVGSFVYACWKHGVPVANEENALHNDYRDLLNELTAYVQQTTDYETSTGFNDDDSTVWQDVVKVAKGFRDKVCA